MGIRVNKDSLIKQLEYKKETYKLSNPYCQSIINNELPFTIGGGIGQSRLCMYYLKKKHIGEVQSSYWPSELKEEINSFVYDNYGELEIGEVEGNQDNFELIIGIS